MANRPLSKTFCETCGQVFTPRDAMQTYQNRYFHPQCFRCASCGNSMAGKPFYPKPNNQFQCESCNDALAPVYESKEQDDCQTVLFVVLVAAYAIERFNQVQKQNDFKNDIIIAIVSGTRSSLTFSNTLTSCLFSVVVNVMLLFPMVNFSILNPIHSF